MRKALLAYALVLFCFLFVLGWILIKGLQSEITISPINEIGEAVCAKFEYSGNVEDKIFITSEIKTLSNVFQSLDIEESEKNVSEWIYRITFNCAEFCPADQEIVVLIGSDAMSINGKNYSTSENVSFECVVDIFNTKYDFFSEAIR